jgi:hypothetical protein
MLGRSSWKIIKKMEFLKKTPNSKAEQDDGSLHVERSLCFILIRYCEKVSEIQQHDWSCEPDENSHTMHFSLVWMGVAEENTVPSPPTEVYIDLVNTSWLLWIIENFIKRFKS